MRFVARVYLRTRRSGTRKSVDPGFLIIRISGQKGRCRFGRVLENLENYLKMKPWSPGELMAGLLRTAGVGGVGRGRQGEGICGGRQK